jgi:hypothetical protein
MPATYSVWDRREGASRTDLALAALQLCRRWRAQPGVESAKYYWLNASKIFVMVEGEADGLQMSTFNQDADNAAAGFALDDVAQMAEAHQLADARGGNDAFQLAGSPTGAA